MAASPRVFQLPHRSPIVLAAASAFAVVPVWANAQAAPQSADDAVELEEVVVTATRRSTSVQDIPLNIAAVGSVEIDRLGLTDLGDLTQVVPGLHLVDQGGRDSNLLIVRGINGNALGASEGVGNSAGGTVATYVDDTPVYVDLQLLDIERVEVLLGPQGTLYGAGTLAGAVRYILNKPKLGQTSASLQTGVLGLSHSGDWGSESVLTGNLPLGDTTAVRAVLGYKDIPGFIDYDYVVREPGVSDPEPDFSDPDAVAANLRRVPDANDEQVTSARISVLQQLGSRATATLSYSYQDQEAGARTVNSAQAIGTGDYVSALRYEEPNDRSIDLYTLSVEADLGFATLTSATGYSQYDEVGQRDQTDLLLDFEYGYEDFPTFSAYTREVVDENRFNQELRLVSNDAGRINWILGGFYNSRDTDATSSEFAPGIPEFFGVDRPDNLEYFQLTKDEFSEYAVFGELGFDITDAWSVTVGGRWFQYKQDLDVGFALPLIDGSAPDEILLDSDTVSVKDDNSIFKFNTAYAFNDDLLSYFTVSQGFRNGGGNAVPACDVPLEPGQNVCALPNEQAFKPDKTLNYELGLHSEWLERRLTVNGALYYVDWTDPQLAGTTVNGNIPITLNAEGASSYGVELGMRWRVLPSLTVAANYTYVKAELTDDADTIIRGGPAFDGDRLPGSPEHLANLSVGWSRPLGNGAVLDIDYRVSATSDVYSSTGLHTNRCIDPSADGPCTSPGVDEFAAEVLSGYVTHDLSAGISRDNWRVRVYAKNLFDTYYETGVRTNESFIRTIDGADSDNGDAWKLRSLYKSVGEPLRVGFSVTWNFEA